MIDCVMVFDGNDTNGDEWNRCTTHNRLVLGDAYVCEGYEPPPYKPPPYQITDDDFDTCKSPTRHSQPCWCKEHR